MPLENRTLALLDEEATRRGVSVQELMGTVIVPEWLSMKNPVMKSAAISHPSRTIAFKLSSLERAFQDLKAEIERGVLIDQSDRALLKPVKLIRSIEALLTKTFGRVNASNLLYEIGKETGRHSVTGVEKDIDKASSVNKFQQVCSSFAPVWGWERLRTKNFDFSKRVVISNGEGSVYVRKKTGRISVCHFGRGALAGALGIVLRADCESLEIACEGKGDGYCEIVSGAPDEIARLAESLEGPATLFPPGDSHNSGSS